MFLPFHDENPTQRAPLVTYALIAANVLVFVWATYLVAPQKQEQLLLQRGFIPKRVSQLWDPVPVLVPRNTVMRDPISGRNVVLQRQIAFPPDRPQIVLSMFTSMFMHGGWFHLIFNMWFLWIFGANVEDRLGRVIFPIFYIVGGLLAGTMHWVSAPDSVVPVVGASGAVAAVLGAYAITWPWARVQTLVFLFFIYFVIEVPAFVLLGVWFTMQIMGMKGASGGVAWWAHIGGFVVGLLFMPLLCDFLGSNTLDEEQDDETQNEQAHTE